ncbi:hypothetical protein [Dendrosporobacter sp. 1207_IL3150]|uniref:hypothetical protein n=1 Tax=Dendrosporobacter sp. 1207_IL3150 TaxID=3084054 RepID=UPI002FDB2EC6
MTQNRLAKRAIDALFLAAQILIIMLVAERGNYNYIRGIAATSSFWLVYIYLESKIRFEMSNYIRTAMVITLLSDGFFGYYLEYYLTSTLFDKAQHLFGSYSFALFTYVLVAQLLNNPVKPLFKFILIVGLGISLGATYEVLEFIVDSTTHPYPPGQPSLIDTDLDLIADIIGSVIAAYHAVSVNFINRNF